MRHLNPIIALVLLAAAAACAPAGGPTTPTPSVAPSAAASSAVPASPAASAASPATSVAPSAAASSAPSATPPAPASVPPSAAAPAFDLTQGELLRKYDFKGIGGVHYDFARDQIAVIDGVDDDATPRRYLLRRFNRDGSFDVAIDLHADREDPPEAVHGFAFDLAGVPAFTFLEDEAFSLRRLYTATVLPASRLPNSAIARAGLAALGADGNVFTWGVIRYDPDALKGDTRDREIHYFRAEEDEEPEALFRIRDPFEPTTRMAVAPGGVLYLMGPTAAGTLELKRLGKDQRLETVPVPLPKIPEHLWIDPAGNLLLATETTGNEPAIIRRYAPSGEALGQTEVRLADGRKVYALDGLAFDALGHVIAAGTAIDADLKTTSGLFTFD